MAEGPTSTHLFAIWCERAAPPRIEALFADRAVIIGSADASPADPLAKLSASEAIIASARLRYDDALMATAPQLRVISRTGTGVDNIDIAAATERGIAVCNVPGGPTRSTAEHAIALLLAVSKRLKPAEAALRDGPFDQFNRHDAIELNGRVLGIVGLGAIGQLVAKFGTALGMDVIAYDPYVSRAVAAALLVKLSGTLDDLLRRADVISLHAPLTTETAHIIDRGAIGRMRQGAIVINTARGGLVDEGALLEALESGRIGGAGLDVFDPEPPAHDHPLLHRLDVVATPHIAAATVAGRERLWTSAIEQALEVLNGQHPAHLVNPEAVRIRPGRSAS